MKVSDFTLLLVEDDANDVLLLQRAFARASLVNPVKIVRDGQEAIDYLAAAMESRGGGQTPLPSLIFLDLKLPKKSGLEVLEWIKAQTALKHIPVIVLSSSRENDDIQKAYAMGASSYLVKPVDPAALIDMVNAIRMYWVILNKSPEQPPS